MSNWNTYCPDYNPPPGIPAGYPYALNPSMPTANPMYPPVPSQQNPPGYPQSGTSPYPPATGSPYPAAGYPPTNPSYPPLGSSPYAPANSPYPSPGMSPYPPSSDPPLYSAPGTNYPSTGSNYPSTGPNYPSTGSNYPTTGTNYPSTGTNYPSTGPNYPSTGPNYPSTGPNYPSTGPNYPSTGPSPYPGGVTSSYPSNPSSPYTAGVSPSGPYPGSGNPASNYNSNYTSRNMAMYGSEGTVMPYANFNPQEDAEALRKAMKGFGTDEKAIIKILANRSNSQRVYIATAFKQLYGKDLVDDLKSELSGNFENVIVALMMATNEFLASQLHKAISGVGTDEDVLIEVLCSRTNQEIWTISQAYTQLYGKSMEDDIKGDTSGHFQRLLVSCCTGARSEAPPDGVRAKQTAQSLYDAGAGQWGTDESVFNSILVAESFEQLRHTFYEYQKIAGKTVAEAIESEMSGNLKQGMLAIAKCVENRPFYFAEKLYKSMKVGLGTDDDTLVRIVVSRCEIDMVNIKAEYERNYGKPLGDAIADDTSGDYKRMLLALVNPN